MKIIDKELESIAKKMMKGKVPSSKLKKPTPKGKGGKYISAKEPTDAMGWLKQAYGDNDPKAGSPKVGDIGYV